MGEKFREDNDWKLEMMISRSGSYKTKVNLNFFRKRATR